MKSKANKVTFCETCVVMRIVTTHFVNPTVGKASGLSRSMAVDPAHEFSARFSVSVDSNQNKQVI